MDKKDIKKKGFGGVFSVFGRTFSSREKRIDVSSSHESTRNRENIEKHIDELAGEALRELAKR